MDAELQKLVEAGKLTTAGAGQLDQLKPGAFCLHKSWGFGRVADWNLLLNQILIDFEKKKAHPMQLQYAAENLTPIPADHFLARKANDLPALKNPAEGRSGRRDAQHSREPWRQGDAGADQRLVVRRRFQRGGIQTLVGLDQETA